MKKEQLLPDVNLSDATRESHPEVVETRHALHMIPEVGLDLPKTAAYVENRLDDIGVKHRRCIENGVVGLIESAGPGPVVMLRADMDALPVTEETGHEYVSTHQGQMHACGHDTHMAMLLGAARRLHSEGIDNGTLKLVFQPGEEGAHGAQAMIADGVMENPKVDLIYGQHIWAGDPVGQVLIEDGPVMAAVDTVYIKVTGKGTHAALPHLGHDPIFAGAQIVTALQSIVTRNVDPMQPAVVTVSVFQAGTVHNVIPPFADLTLSVRVFDDEIHDMIEQRIKDIVTGVADSLGCSAEIKYVREHEPVINDAGIVEIVREEAAAIVGKDNVIARQRSMGAEDMSDYMRIAPGAFAFIGGGNEAKDCVYPHHHPKFNIDEDALAIGTELMYRMAKRLLAR